MAEKETKAERDYRRRGPRTARVFPFSQSQLPPFTNCVRLRLVPPHVFRQAHFAPAAHCHHHNFIPSLFPFQSNAYSPFGPQNAASTRLVFLRAECCTPAVSASTLCLPPIMAAAAVRTTIGHQWLRVAAGISCRRRQRRLHRQCLRCTI